MEFVQVGLNTSDLAGSLRLYSEAFGFENAGGQGLWGETIRTQGLGSDSRALMWWLVGSQEFFQLEFFHHTEPRQRPLPDGWRPCDQGWVRIGIAVPDFTTAAMVLERHNIALLGSVASPVRRMGFQDPYTGMAVEIVERTDLNGPAFLYAASSVFDLEAARVYYRDVLNLTIEPLEALHQPEDEALWGLAGAKRDGFVASAGDRKIEVVRYDDPIAREKPSDYCIADQGIMNIALASRSLEEVEELLDRLTAAGYVPPALMKRDGIMAGYINDREREIEFAALPKELDAFVGFEKIQEFFN